MGKSCTLSGEKGSGLILDGNAVLRLEKLVEKMELGFLTLVRAL